jgi:hypothetical protein
MSTMIKDDICYCDCHEKKDIMNHAKPCCEGLCPICLHHIKNMQYHMKNVHGISSILEENSDK